MTAGTGLAAADELALREYVRNWIGEHLTPEFFPAALARLDTDERVEVRRRWERELLDGELLASSWPVEHGGQGLEPWQEVVIEEELGLAGAPDLINLIGFRLAGPVLLDVGRDEQKEHFLPRILSGDDIWCQGFSEPGAGSDLASLQASAVDHGDHYVVNGQKVWTSWAMHAQKCLLLARTDRDVPKHQGITAFAVDMDTPGIDVRPVRQITGESEFCEVFFDGVAVPRDRIIGVPGQGWEIARLTLLYERGSNFVYLAGVERTFRGLVARLRARPEPPAGDVITRLVAAQVELAALQATARSYLDRLTAGTADPTEASLIKLGWTELDVAIKDLALEVAGTAAVVRAPGAEPSAELHEMLASRAETIYGGTSEIQRNLIAERLLGLPKGG